MLIKKTFSLAIILSDALYTWYIARFGRTVVQNIMNSALILYLNAPDLKRRGIILRLFETSLSQKPQHPTTSNS
jgi:hypothetical protein